MKQSGIHDKESSSIKTVVACQHCGLPVPPALVKTERNASFCCAGCEAVYSFLQACNLEDYYRLRETYQESAPRPAKVSGGKFLYLDDPKFLLKYGKPRAEGHYQVFFYLDNIHCLACSWLVEKILMERENAQYARLNLSTHVLEVVFNPITANLSNIAQTLDKLGYTPHLVGQQKVSEFAEKESKALLARMAVAGAVTGNIMILAVSQYAGDISGIDAEHSNLFRWISLGLSLPSVFYSAWPFYKSAIQGLKSKLLNIELPVSLGIWAAFGVSTISVLLNRGEVYFDTLTMLIFLLLVGRYLMSRASRWAASNSESLLLSSITAVKRIKQQVTEEVSLAQIEMGDRLLILPGEVIPVDGEMESESGYVQESHLSGESLPILKYHRDLLFAGAVVEISPIEMTATAVGDTTRLAKLVELTQTALTQRTRIATILDRAAAYFVAGMILVSVATGIVWYFIDPSKWLWNAVTVLIITCPCALGLAAPVALAAATGRAARKGIFIKNPESLSRLTQINRVVLDKTGTVTEGKMKILEKFFEDGSSPEEQKKLLFSSAVLEKLSGHIYAFAFSEFDTNNTRVPDCRFIKGAGVEGTVEGKRYCVGSHKFISERVTVIPEKFLLFAEKLSAEGLTVIFVACESKIAAVFGLGDALQKDAAKTVEKFHKQKIAVELLSGDNAQSVAQKARELKIDIFNGCVSPEEKLQYIDQLESKGCRTVMIGDGINDAAALRRATVGISVSHAADAARDAADIFITSNGLSSAYEAMRISQHAFKIIKIILWISILYNTAGAVLAMTGLLNPLVSAVMMPVSSITVLLIASKA